MAVQKVLRMGHPVLLQKARPVETFNSAVLDALVADMLDTMRATNGAGLAAPQIGVDLRVVIFELTKNPRYPDAPPVPLTILVNPVITPLSDDMHDAWEGCLSIPGMRGLVPRFSRIRYCGFTPAGESIDREVDNFHARVVQHECDHLDGVLYPYHIRDLTKFGFIEELELAGLLPKIKESV